MSDERKSRTGWAVVQQMGHVTIAGYVTETTLAGYGVLSVAIPDGDRTVEKLIPPSTLYDLTWVGEEEARSVARKHPVEVIDDWTIRQETKQRIEAEERERIQYLHTRRGECATCGRDIPGTDGAGTQEATVRTHTGDGRAVEMDDEDLEDLPY